MSGSDEGAPGPLARRDGEPVFDEPWQAQVLALAFNLIERGALSNAEWSDALGAQLRAAADRGEPDDPQTYYRSALAALETLLSADGRITTALHSREFHSAIQGHTRYQTGITAVPNIR